MRGVSAVSNRWLLYVTLGCLAGFVLIVAGQAVADMGHTHPEEVGLESGPPLVEDPLSVEKVEWDNPCGHFYKDVENEISAEGLSARCRLPADLTVSGLGEIEAMGCMAGSDTGLEAIVVHRGATATACIRTTSLLRVVQPWTGWNGLL